MTDQALVEEGPDRAELIVPVYFRIDAVELPEVDALDLEPTQAHVDALSQIVGIADLRPRARVVGVADQAALGRDRQSFIGMKRLGDQILADERSIAVGCIDEVDSDLGQSLEDAYRLFPVGRFPPDARPGVRMAPKPRRVTVRSPPMTNCPEALASIWVMLSLATYWG